ncbi:MAG TPA: response regulator [Cyclobacteriaceae bacterium]|nr:response regulator [Cyclobacteriaceae bacterium]
MYKQPIIALIDDDEVFQFTSTRMIKLQKISDEVQLFNNGEEAIKYLKQNAHNPDKLPDIILLDINMPITDGWMFLDAYDDLELSKEITIYMLSSSIAREDLDRAKANPHIKDYLVKPLMPETLSELFGQNAI